VNYQLQYMGQTQGHYTNSKGVHKNEEHNATKIKVNNSDHCKQKYAMPSKIWQPIECSYFNPNP